MDDLLKIIQELEALKAKLDAQSVVLGNVIVELKALLPITGFVVEPQQKGQSTMATFKCKAKKGQKAARKFKAGDVINPAAPFTITDDPNTPGGYLILLTNAAGDLIDGSAIATSTVSADASGNLTASSTGPMGFSVQGVHAGPAIVSVTVTITDGSSGPFSGDVSFQVNPGGPTGFVVVPA